MRALFLGFLFSIGLIISFSSNTWRVFGWYTTAMAFFHWSEYFITSWTNPGHVTLESYLLDHSREYHIAAVASWVEFTVEWYFFPGNKIIVL